MPAAAAFGARNHPINPVHPVRSRGAALRRWSVRLGKTTDPVENSHGTTAESGPDAQRRRSQNAHATPQATGQAINNTSSVVPMGMRLLVQALLFEPLGNLPPLGLPPFATNLESF